MITVAVTYVFRAGTEAQAEAHLHELLAAVTDEPGCRTFSVHRSLEHPRTYMLFEQYDDRDALDAHRVTPYFLRLVKNGLQTLAESRTPSLYEPFA